MVRYGQDLSQFVRRTRPRASQRLYGRTVTFDPVTIPRAQLRGTGRRYTGGMPIRPSSARPGGGIMPRIDPSLARPRLRPDGGVIPPSRPTDGIMPPQRGIIGGDGVVPTLGLGTFGTGLSSMGGNIMDQIRSLLPLAIKVVLAFIAIKIVLWLIRGRR